MTCPALPPLSSVRACRPADVDVLVAMIRELAAYERSEDQVKITPERLLSALFAPQPAVFALLAEVDGEPAGFALYFVSFSTWEGVHGIYLEDLYVRPQHRGSGLGKALLGRLASIAMSRGYARFEWAVLDWNTPSIAFYEALGARRQEDWTTYRLSGPALAALAEPGDLNQRTASG